MKYFVRNKENQAIQDQIKTGYNEMKGDDGAIKRVRDAFERGSKALEELPIEFSNALDGLFIEMENGRTDAKAA